MPQENLSKHIVRGIKKALQEKATRSQRPANTARDQKPSSDPRRKQWEDRDDAEMPVGRTPLPPATQNLPLDSFQVNTDDVGVVTQVLGSSAVVSYCGKDLRCALPRKRLEVAQRLAVGDKVQVDTAAGPSIIAVLERSSVLRRDTYDASRNDPEHKERILVANVDQVLIMCTPASPPFRPGLIDRYLVEASLDALDAVICLNKTDLGVPPKVERSLEGYARLGLRVIETSMITRSGLDELREVVSGKTSILSGHSGVGKSSMLNALEPGLSLKVGQVNEITTKGRHTTTSSRLVPIPGLHAFLVDSPGVRAFGPAIKSTAEVSSHFPDIAEAAADFRFDDCLHLEEPGCAVRAKGVEDWFLSQRLGSYKKILADLERA